MTATITIKTDGDLKKEFSSFCSAVGMTSTTAINVFMRQVVREKRIPFEIFTVDALPDRQAYEHYLARGVQRGYDDWQAGNTLSRHDANIQLTELQKPV
ncbi:MAG: type II toxin-antitoxin system RelB/DinJ family antitoxin [Raoultibacter sp.]